MKLFHIIIYIFIILNLISNVVVLVKQFNIQKELDGINTESILIELESIRTTVSAVMHSNLRMVSCIYKYSNLDCSSFQ
jgi:hypothetical protein